MLRDREKASSCWLSPLSRPMKHVQAPKAHPVKNEIAVVSFARRVVCLWRSTMACIGILLLSACRPSPVQQTLSELTKQVRKFPTCDVADDVPTVSLAAQRVRAHEDVPQGRLSVRGFLLPHVEQCTEMGCSYGCCNGCSIGWSLAETPRRGISVLRLYGLEWLRAETGVSDCAKDGIRTAATGWSVIATGKLVRELYGSGAMIVDRICLSPGGTAPGSARRKPLPNQGVAADGLLPPVGRSEAAAERQGR
jgi:hypothetical protein